MLAWGLLSADISLDHNWVSLLAGISSYKVTVFPFPVYLRKEIFGVHASSPLCLLNQLWVLLMAQMAEGLNVGFDSFISSIFIIWEPSLRKLFTFSQFMDYFLLLIHLCINSYSFILRVIALYYIHVFSGSDCSIIAVCSFRVGQCPLVCCSSVNTQPPACSTGYSLDKSAFSLPPGLGDIIAHCSFRNTNLYLFVLCLTTADCFAEISSCRP